jgi:Fe-S cluster assembly ATPase SufC
MSDLRERIAAAIKAADKRVAGFISYEERADAVIEALQIQPEYGHLDETDSGIIADTIQELGEPCPGETLRHRYITPWKDINETD